VVHLMVGPHGDPADRHFHGPLTTTVCLELECGAKLSSSLGVWDAVVRKRCHGGGIYIQPSRAGMGLWDWGRAPGWGGPPAAAGLSAPIGLEREGYISLAAKMSCLSVTLSWVVTPAAGVGGFAALQLASPWWSF
jgi:hypothetical protein